MALRICYKPTYLTVLTSFRVRGTKPRGKDSAADGGRNSAASEIQSPGFDSELKFSFVIPVRFSYLIYKVSDI